MEDDPGRLVQVGAQQLVAAAGDVAGVILLAGLVAPRRQADVGPDAGRLGEALRRIHDADVGERDQDGGRPVRKPAVSGCRPYPPRAVFYPSTSGAAPTGGLRSGLLGDGRHDRRDSSLNAIWAIQPAPAAGKRRVITGATATTSVGPGPAVQSADRPARRSAGGALRLRHQGGDAGQ